MPLFTLRCQQEAPLFITKPPKAYKLSQEECHVWIGKADQPVLRNVNAAVLLSELELSKAAKFRNEKDRALYVAAHAMLRLVLSRYTGIAPEKIRITQIPGRKPVVAAGMPSLQFNLSHAENCVAVAISPAYPVGIDVEKVQAGIEWESIAHHYFSASELKCLQLAAPRKAAGVFYTFWTRKEAFLKATGLGLIDDLSKIDTAAHATFRLEDSRLSHTVPENWQLNTFSPEPDFYISLALPEIVNRISAFHWNFDHFHLR